MASPRFLHLAIALATTAIALVGSGCSASPPAPALGSGAYTIASPHAAYFLVNRRMVGVDIGMEPTPERGHS